MSSMPSQSMADDLRPQETGQAPRAVSEWPSSGMLLTGLAVVAVGFLVWNYVGPDLKRYLKIYNM